MARDGPADILGPENLAEHIVPSIDGVGCEPSTASSSPPPPSWPSNPPNPSIPPPVCACFLNPPRIAGSNASAPAFAVSGETPRSRAIESMPPAWCEDVGQIHCLLPSLRHEWQPFVRWGTITARRWHASYFTPARPRAAAPPGPSSPPAARYAWRSAPPRPRRAPAAGTRRARYRRYLVKIAGRLIRQPSAGQFASARATATRCCSPPESWLGRCVSRAPRPSAVSSLRSAPGVGERRILDELR
ncbi:hypothetical protein DdX_22432 [Ditylenchus destructor]|uniref:Uncharacterized protein n=1 Tax=Ditylenchus destructor TaxID=166010 RepID=A0AAD4QUP6_9BILA|nr:hypothetical protein DdX_22432 [Ditylenchus destructor]